MTRRIFGGSDPFYLKFYGKLNLLKRKRLFSIDISPYSASAVNTLPKKVQLTLIRSSLCAFSWAY